MNKKDTVEKLCRIVKTVSEAHDDRFAADCFCIDKHVFNFCVEDQLIEFIRIAVNEKLERDGLTIPDIPEE